MVWNGSSPDAPGHSRLKIGYRVETSASIEIAKHTLLSCGLILAIGTLTGLLAQKIRVPDVAVFLVVGMGIGPEALGLIDIRPASPRIRRCTRSSSCSAPAISCSMAALR